MDGNTASGESDDIDWNTEDELEIASYCLPSCSSMTVNDVEAIVGSTEASLSAGSSSSKMIDHFVGMGFSEQMVAKAIQENREQNSDAILETLLKYSASSSAGSSSSKMIDHFVGMGFSEQMVAKATRENGEQNSDAILETLLKYSASSSASSSKSKLIDHFVGMGFSEEMIVKAIQENGEEKTDSILETLLTYSALEKSQVEEGTNSDHHSPGVDSSFLDDFSDIDSLEGEEITNPDSDKENKLLSLARMGYSTEEASIAMERCAMHLTVLAFAE